MNRGAKRSIATGFADLGLMWISGPLFQLQEEVLLQAIENGCAYRKVLPLWSEAIKTLVPQLNPRN